MYYRVVFSKSTKSKSLLKILLLIAGLFCDIAAIIGILMAAFGMPKYLCLLGSLAFSVLFRIIALRLIYNVESKLQDNHLIISKVYPDKTKIVFKEKLGDFKVFPFDIETSNDFAVNNETIMCTDSKNAQIQEQNVTNNCEKEENKVCDNLTFTSNAMAIKTINLLADNYEKYMVIGKNLKVLCNLDRYIYSVSLKGEEIWFI